MAAETSDMQAQRDGMYNIIDTNEPWKGRMLFTGPNYNRDHRVKVGEEHRHTGIGTMSKEGSSEADYLWRAAPSTPHPKPRAAHIGEVGWGIPLMTDWKMPQTGRQVVLGDFRQECEDRHSHLYQHAWYPGPNDEISPESDAALIMNVYRPKTTPNKSRSGRTRSPLSRYRSGSGRYRQSPTAFHTTFYDNRTNYETNILTLRDYTSEFSPSMFLFKVDERIFLFIFGVASDQQLRSFTDEKLRKKEKPEQEPVTASEHSEQGSSTDK